MDYDIFKRQLKKAYSQSCCSFTINECWDILVYYFLCYEEYTKHSHPPIKTELLTDILDKMGGNDDIEFDAECYRDMIILYFTTPFKNCDRNICHFFSGKIRELRYYELEKEGAINL